MWHCLHLIMLMFICHVHWIQMSLWINEISIPPLMIIIYYDYTTLWLSCSLYFLVGFLTALHIDITITQHVMTMDRNWKHNRTTSPKAVSWVFTDRYIWYTTVFTVRLRTKCINKLKQKRLSLPEDQGTTPVHYIYKSECIEILQCPADELTEDEYIYIMSTLGETIRREMEEEYDAYCIQDEPPEVHDVWCPCCMTADLVHRSNMIYCTHCTFRLQCDPSATDPLALLSVLLCDAFTTHGASCLSRPACHADNNHVYMHCDVCRFAKCII